MPCTPKNNTPRNLGDLLCTLNFDIQPDKTTNNNPAGDENVRKVATPTTEVLPKSNEPNTTPHLDQTTKNAEEPLVTDQNVSTSTCKENTVSSNGIESTTPLGTCSVITITSSDSSLTTDPMKQPVTPTKLAMMDHVDANTLLIDDDSNQTRASATLDSTPRSVVTNPDAAELETTNVLLQLGNLGDIGSEQQDQLDVTYDNSDLLPVDAAPLEDFARDMMEKEKEKDTGKNVKETDLNNNKANDDKEDKATDSDKTVDYNVIDPSTEKAVSPKGSLKYKQYGIARQSPKTAPNRSCHCPYCETTCHSKRDWNNHHKTEHAKVKCPDCGRLFPTPDALNHHRYVHDESHRFKCALCDKICPFKK